MGKICTFFGHRKTYLDDEEKENICNKVIELIENEDVDTFLFGGYGMFDSACAGIVRRLQKKYPHITTHLLLPYPKRASKYATAFYEEYDFDMVSYFDPDMLIYPRYTISKRNDYMAKTCDFMICYVIFSWGGAHRAMQKAIRSKKQVFNFAPL